MKTGGGKMKLNEAMQERGRNNPLYAFALILLAIGVTVGSIYLVRVGADSGEGIKTYINNFFSSFAENRNNIEVFKNSLTANLVCIGIIFLMGFFRFGFLITGAILVRKGFVMGFTAASFFKYYGIKGMLVMLSNMPTMLITLPALLFFSAASVRFSLIREKNQKNLIFSYIFFLILAISIFCVASFSEGFLTTTFMTWLSPKIS